MQKLLQSLRDCCLCIQANLDSNDLAEEPNSMPAEALHSSPGLSAGLSSGLSAALLGSSPIDPGPFAAAAQPSNVATKKRKMREAEQQPLLLPLAQVQAICY